MGFSEREGSVGARTHTVEFDVTVIGYGSPGDHELAEIDASITSHQPATFEHKYETRDTFTVDLYSHFSGSKDVRALGLVYRDSNDDIIGGWGSFDYRQYRDSDEIPENRPEILEFSVAPGTADPVEIEAITPPDFDETNVDIYAAPYISRDDTTPNETCVECYAD